MKHKINLVGNSFTHLTGGNKGYSVHGKESQYVEWAFDLSADETVYVDQNINQAFTDKVEGTKYGWLLESKFVVPGIAEEIKANLEDYFSVFKYIFTHDKELLELNPRFKWCAAQGKLFTEPGTTNQPQISSNCLCCSSGAGWCSSDSWLVFIWSRLVFIWV